MSSTPVYKLDPAAPDPALIEQAAAVIRGGGLVAFPTETVYGLGANALDAQAVERIFAAKQRPANDPIIVHIHDDRQLRLVARDMTAAAWRMVEAFFPGALTLVLHRGDAVPPSVSSGLPTVAVRMPSGTIARALLAAAEVPIAAPSANTFSRPSATTAQHVVQDLDGRIDLILDGGATAIGVESTVLDMTGDTPTVLRPGGVTLESLRALLPNLRVREKYTAMDSKTADVSPGMLIKHYAPRATVHVFAGDDAEAIAAMRQRAASLLSEGKRVGVLLFDEERPQFDGLRVDIDSLGSIDTLETAAARLFAALRDLDAHGVDAIVVRAPKRKGLGAAIYDRLRRAAQGIITNV